MTFLRLAIPAVSAALFSLGALAGCGADPQTDSEASSSGSLEGTAQSGSQTTTGVESDSTGPQSSSTGGSTSSSSSGATSSADSSTATTANAEGPSGPGSTGASDSSTGGPIEVDISQYTPTGEAVSIPAPGNNASGVTWNYDTDRVWVVENGAGRFHEYAADDFSAPIRGLRLVGINGNDTEGLAYLGNGEVAVAFEGGYGVYIADVPDGDTDAMVPVKQTLTLAPPPPVGNNGLEGIAFDPDAEVFYAVGEGQDAAAPRRLFRFARPSVENEDFDWQDPELSVEEPFIADDVLPESGASLDLAGIAFDTRDGNVLIISHTGSRVMQLDPNRGAILSELPLTPNQWEGVALVGPASDLVLIAESNEMQRFTLTD